eukprot:6208121-Pleurochrysis_carterae.AAC.1
MSCGCAIPTILYASDLCSHAWCTGTGPQDNCALIVTRGNYCRRARRTAGLRTCRSLIPCLHARRQLSGAWEPSELAGIMINVTACCARSYAAVHLVASGPCMCCTLVDANACVKACGREGEDNNARPYYAVVNV